jgi:hypothetical protein
MKIDYPFHFDERGRTASVDEADHIREAFETSLVNPFAGPLSAEKVAAYFFSLRSGD